VQTTSGSSTHDGIPRLMDNIKSNASTSSAEEPRPNIWDITRRKGMIMADTSLKVPSVKHQTLSDYVDPDDEITHTSVQEVTTTQKAADQLIHITGQTHLPAPKPKRKYVKKIQATPETSITGQKRMHEGEIRLGERLVHISGPQIQSAHQPKRADTKTSKSGAREIIFQNDGSLTEQGTRPTVQFKTQPDIISIVK
jgi:hypothetical protein